MKIDYKKFSDYSLVTQQEITNFAKMLLNLIEMFDIDNKGEIRVYDFEKGSFDLQKMSGLWRNLNSVLGETISEISQDPISGWGPPNNRRLTVDLTIKYKLDTVLVLKKFLKRFDKSQKKQNDDIKILLEINKQEKEVRNVSNEKIYSFRKSDGKNKRFEYLLIVVNSSKKVGGKKLNPNISAQTLSGEISEINKNLKNNLSLMKEIILNENNSGYKANKDTYDFQIV